MAESSSNVKVVATDSDFQKELSLSGDRLLVVDFTASWCGPCQTVAPKFEELSRKYQSESFLKVDVDHCKNTAAKYQVKSVPTFIFFKNNKQVHTVKGADIPAVEAGIVQHSTGGDPPAGGSGVPKVPGQHSLAAVIEKTGSECLNEKDNHPFTNCLTPGSASYLESDCDEQLIISFKFSQPIRLHSVVFRAPNDGRGPKTVKLFTNQPHTMDFDQAEQQRPVQEVQLAPEDLLEDSIVGLSYVKFQNVQNLTVFIKDNQGGEEITVVEYLGLYGTPIDATNMTDFKRVAGEVGESH